jgi:uncharacterized protein
MIDRSLPIVPSTAGPDPAAPTGSVEERFEALGRRLHELLGEGLVVTFSGGVDSAFLLWAASRARNGRAGSLVALTSISESVPAADLEDSRRFTNRLGVEHLVRRSRETSHPEYLRNDENRCYHCKAELFRIAGEVASDRGLRWIAYGYSASDRHDVRPGHQAALEHGVVSPLAEVGLGKEDIRRLMRDHGLEMADKPASPCLSSRITTGVEITPDRLAHVQAMEDILDEAGVRVHRVRVCPADRGLFLRLEVAPEEMEKVLPLRDQLLREARSFGYRWVTLDLAGYRTGGGRS